MLYSTGSIMRKRWSENINEHLHSVVSYPEKRGRREPFSISWVYYQAGNLSPRNNGYFSDQLTIKRPERTNIHSKRNWLM